MVLGAHDISSKDGQQAAVKAVYSEPYDGSHPPLHDLSLIYLSAPARLGTRPHLGPQISRHGTGEPAVLHNVVFYLHVYIDRLVESDVLARKLQN